MTVSRSSFVFGLIVVILAGANLLIAAAGGAGGPWEGQWFVAPVVGAITLLAGYLKQATGQVGNGSDTP